jgi:8-oxo-dGTP pyrophosphatase MutT (NUDIX family)
MRATKIVTCFITNENKILLLRRSDKVKSMKGLWAGVSGIIEKDEQPLARAKREIFEEIGLHEAQIKLLKSEKEMRIISPQYKNHEW